ncbi:MAG: tetratricopeptide repeat protein [Bacteroidetes bacterium]|nr:tetratricopeptide repeat protein [Bacteroidota bacterium]
MMKPEVKLIRKLSFLWLLFALINANGYAQSAEIDSLRKVLASNINDTMRVNTLIELSKEYYVPPYEEALAYATEAKDLAEQIGFSSGLGYAYKSIGLVYYLQSKLVDALFNWEESLKVFQEINDLNGVSNMMNNIGAIYFTEGNDVKALDYYLKSLKIAESIKDTLRIATALVNLGAIYSSKENSQDMALNYYQQSIALSEILNDFDAIGASSVNIGEIYLAQGNDTAALHYFNKSMEAYRKTPTGNVPYAMIGIAKVYFQRGEYPEAIQFLNGAYRMAIESDKSIEQTQALIELGRIYKEKKEYKLAVEKLLEAEAIADTMKMRKELKDTYEELSLAYSEMGEYKNAFKYNNLLVTIKDTIYNAVMDKNMQRQALMYDIEKQQGEIEVLAKDKELQEVNLKRQKTIRNATALTGVLLLLLAGGLFNRYKYVRRTSKIIANEKDRSDKLLLNILPEETAEELKEKGFATPKHYGKVSVLFTDFKGFTKIAEKLTPHDLVRELNQCFIEFDRIIDKYNLEKIKTIGDAYMCAGGIPVANDSNPVDIVHAALEIKEYMENLKKEREKKGKDYWELRIGVHTGPVIAGVVGKNKFAYDIWGDAVNTASRMESSGIPGQVNISGFTYEFIKDYFECTYRGKIEAKNKGEIDMYIVDSKKINDKKPNMVEQDVSILS